MAPAEQEPLAVRAATQTRKPPGPFPPDKITSWVQGGAVQTRLLVEQLRAWADYFAE